jgi:cytochrome c553
MKLEKITLLLFVSILLLSSSIASAAEDHAQHVKGSFKSGPEVTKVCLECHEKQATDFMKTTHWNWKGTPNHVKD